jgi:hypothetical protein
LAPFAGVLDRRTVSERGRQHGHGDVYRRAVRVAELWRFPVKSLQGEQLGSATVTAAGIVGDRAFAIFDVATGLGLTARRIPELLDASARVVDDGAPPEITLPDGSIARDDAALSDWLGRRVTLCAAADVVDRRY